jgi:hypothetical protein
VVAPGGNKVMSIVATNSGSAAITIASAAVSTKYFSVSSPALPVTLGAGQSATLSIDFSPSAAGSFSANVTIVSNASNAMATFAVSGSGTTTVAGQLMVNPATLPIGKVVDGSSGTSSGSLTASGGSVTITAASTNNSVFSVGGLSLPVTLADGQSVSYTITFSPLMAGAMTSILTIQSNAQPSTVTASLTGTGTAAPTHAVTLSWNASTSANVVGYNIYRAAYGTSCGSYSQVNSLITTETVYTDTSVVDGSAYCYASTSLNTSNEESTYSNIVSNVTIPAQ